MALEKPTIISESHRGYDLEIKRLFYAIASTDKDWKERITIVRWLTPIDYSLQHHDFISRREPGTGQWLLESAEY